MSETSWIMKNSSEPQKRAHYHHGDLKLQLIEATRQLVEEKGPDHFSVSEACRRAGVSTAAPYKHFKDKGEMLRAVALGGMERKLQQMLDSVTEFEPGSIDRIIALGRVYVGFATAEPGVFRLMFGLSEDHDEYEDLVRTGDAMGEKVQQEVALYRGSDVVEEQDIRRAFLLWSFVHGISFLLIDGKLSKMDMDFDLDSLLAEIADRVMHDRA